MYLFILIDCFLTSGYHCMLQPQTVQGFLGTMPEYPSQGRAAAGWNMAIVFTVDNNTVLHHRIHSVWCYLVRCSYITIWKWVTVLVNGVHGEAGKHSQAHSYPQSHHVHVQRPEGWSLTCQHMHTQLCPLLTVMHCRTLTSWHVPVFCMRCSVAPGTGWSSR